jgi:hypothetical protein
MKINGNWYTNDIYEQAATYADEEMTYTAVYADCIECGCDEETADKIASCTVDILAERAGENEQNV